MSGSTIYEAMTDIDDELIERAYEYKPRSRSFRVPASVLAAALVLLVGTFAVNSMRMGNKSANQAEMYPNFSGGIGAKSQDNNTADCAEVDVESFENGQAQENVKEISDEGATECQVSGTAAAGKEDGTGSSEPLFSVSNTTSTVAEEEDCTVVGELYGYTVELGGVVMGEYFISEYKIYVTKDETRYLLSESLLDEKQKKEVEQLVEEYLLKEGLK